MPASPTAVPGARSADRYLSADGARLRYRDERWGAGLRRRSGSRGRRADRPLPLARPSRRHRRFPARLGGPSAHASAHDRSAPAGVAPSDDRPLSGAGSVAGSREPRAERRSESLRNVPRARASHQRCVRSAQAPRGGRAAGPAAGRSRACPGSRRRASSQSRQSRALRGAVPRLSDPSRRCCDLIVKELAMPKILVLYYSSYGHIEIMARAQAEGAAQVRGAEVTVKRLPELVPPTVARASGFKLEQSAPLAVPDELEQYDGIVFGTPTRFGNMAAQMRNFL